VLDEADAESHKGAVRKKERPAALALMERRLIKFNADPACLPPNDVTVVIDILDFDQKFE
jgi:hypothetical protein